MQEKFMHRETTISREIKLLKTKFELLEKNRQFRGIFQKSSNNPKSGDTSGELHDGAGDQERGHDGEPLEPGARSRTMSLAQVTADSSDSSHQGAIKDAQRTCGQTDSGRALGSRFTSFLHRLVAPVRPLGRLLKSLFLPNNNKRQPTSMKRRNHNKNRVASIETTIDKVPPDVQEASPPSVAIPNSDSNELASGITKPNDEDNSQVRFVESQAESTPTK